MYYRKLFTTMRSNK